MTTLLSQKSKALIEHINRIVPENVDPEINFALKCYYLGKEHTEDEIIAIMTQRVKELEELKEQMTITSYAELDKSIDTITKVDGENSSCNDAVDTGHENN